MVVVVAQEEGQRRRERGAGGSVCTHSLRYQQNDTHAYVNRQPAS